MSQTKSNVHSIRVKQKPSGSSNISTGGNTEIFLDGVPLKGVTFLKFQFKAKAVTKVKLEMLVKIDEIEGNYQLGNYGPTGVNNSTTESLKCNKDEGRLNYLIATPGLISQDDHGNYWVGDWATEPSMGPFKTGREAIDAALEKTKDKDPVQDLVDTLLKGGDVYIRNTDYRASALARILQEDLTAAVFCDYETQRQDLLKANNSNLSYESRVFLNTNHGNAKYRWDHEPKGSVYIYEYVLGNQYPKFHAALSSRILFNGN